MDSGVYQATQIAIESPRDESKDISDKGGEKI